MFHIIAMLPILNHVSHLPQFYLVYIFQNLYYKICLNASYIEYLLKFIKIKLNIL